MTQNGNGSWQKAALGALWAVVILMAGWAFTDSRASQEEVRREIAMIRQQSGQDQQRIAILEEQARTTLRTLERIENGVEELKRRR